MERDFLKRLKEPIQIMLILLYDLSNEKLIYRDDGKSLSKVDNTKLDLERKYFLEAFDMSSISNKLNYDLSELPINIEGQIDITIITKEILKYL